MSTARLSTTSYVVLGMIAMRGPSTSYDLKRAIGHSVGYFWHFPHAQLYSEPKRLEELGLLESEEEGAGRRRRTYSVTEEGRKALRDWLGEPTEQHFELRDVAEIKLFFNEFAEHEDVARLAVDQQRQHRERIRVYERMRERFGGRSEIASRMVTLRLGLELEYAALNFWRTISEEIEAGEPPFDGGDRS
ncbi:PadR family transcriptional regulator [Streptomonospora arabica]|uniref:Helix-turn-helix transcriptional regulator n=1 Tax=Streptomonospora arabica TaxID=412417 RepID=A0ABV9SF83_9ACTN